MNNAIRMPAVAGMFYPESSKELQSMIDQFLSVPKSSPSRAFKALISPHAGYIYSGPIAAPAYQSLQHREGIERVILLGPSHRVPLTGIATSSASSFVTPLGEVPVDREMINLLHSCEGIAENDLAHQFEHSLEVQLPFLQRALGNFQIVPLVVGQISPVMVADVLKKVWGGAETLIVVSSDLSHYLPYEVAQQKDRVTADGILAFHTDLNGEQACGCYSVNGLLCYGQQIGLRSELLKLANSGDTAGDKSRVVGYGAFGFWEEAA